MSLSDLIRRRPATATLATPATDRQETPLSVATVATVAVATVPAEASAAELAGLVNLVADFNGHTPEERALALELALADPVNAACSFGAAAEKIERLRARGINECSTPAEWRAWFAN